MADKSAIEWTDATWNPVRARNLKTGKIGWHCEHVTTGCDGCYAEGFNKRLGTGLAFKPGHRKDIEIFLDEEMLLQPLRWKRPRMIFPGSMTDLFADFVRDEWLDRIFAVMTLSKQHTYQVLTKRAARMRDYMTRAITPGMIGQCALDLYPGLPLRLAYWPLPNVWLGVSTERQQEADERIPELLRTPAAVRFISYEPALGPLDLQHVAVSKPDEHSVYRTINALTGIRGHGGRFGFTETCDPIQPHLDWIIAGGESGPNARPMHPDWARSLRDQCAAAVVAFFFKQWGAFAECERRGNHYVVGDKRTTVLSVNGAARLYRPDGWAPGNIDEDPTVLMDAIGKAKAGRLLDGLEHNGMPGTTRPAS